MCFSQNFTEQENTVRGQTLEFMNVTSGGIYSYYYALRV
jgi:hypothetical protein